MRHVGYIRIILALVTLMAMFVNIADAISSESKSIVKIGALLPLSGPLARIGKTHMRGHEFAVSEINALGGIHSLGGAKIKMIYADTMGDPVRGMEETKHLIETGVISIMGAYQSAVVIPSSEIAEKERVPYIVTTALSDKITQRKMHYLFRPEANISDFVRDEIRFIEYLFNRKLAGNRLTLLYEDSLFGQFTAMLQRRLARENNLAIVADISYSSNSHDLTEVCHALQAARPDVVLQTSYLLDSIQIARLMDQQKIHPSVIIATGAGPKDPEFIRSLGSASDYWFVVNEWNYDMMRPGAKELNERYRARYGVDMDGIAAMSYMSTWLVKEALENAGTTQREDLARVLRDIDLDYGPGAILPLGGVAFDENGQNRFQTIMTQIIDGKHRTVWPPELASSEPIPRKASW